MQETTFPVEILIHDDASPDGTADIVREFEAKHPNLIKPIYQEVNQYSQGIKPNIAFNYPRALGKYIALCEGDDRWTDPLKLQKQVEFLEANPEYVLSHHDAVVTDSEGQVIEDSKLSDRYKQDFTADEVVRKPYFVTASVCFRNTLPDALPEAMKVPNGDTFLFSRLGLYGKAKYQGNEIAPNLYRVHFGGIWSQLNQVNRLHTASQTYYWMSVYYRRIGKRRYANHCLAVSYSQISQAYYLQGKKAEGKRYLLRALAIQPWSLSLWRSLAIGHLKS